MTPETKPDRRRVRMKKQRRAGTRGFGGGGGDMEERITRLENDVSDIKGVLIRIETKLERFATKEELLGVRAEMREESASLRAEMKEEFVSVRAEMREALAKVATSRQLIVGAISMVIAISGIIVAILKV